MDKRALQQAWRVHGDRLREAVGEIQLQRLRNTDVAEAAEVLSESAMAKKLHQLSAAAELNRFLDHPRDLMRLDAEADRHLSARNAQGEWRVNGYDRVALEAHRERLANEHQWFMEYKRESGISPVNPSQVRHGAQVIELSEDGRSVVTRWDIQTLPGLIRQGWEDLKAEAPQVIQSIRQNLRDHGPSDRTLYELCVSLNRTAAGALGGFTAPMTRAGMSGQMANDVWGEAVGMAAQGPIEQTCRLAIPRSAPSMADWHRQVMGAAPEGNGLHVHEGEAVAHVGVPASWFASHAVADELVERAASGQLQSQEAQTVMHQLAEPNSGVAELWPALLAQAEQKRADAQRLPEQITVGMSGSAWVAESPMLSPMQKANFQALVHHFETPLGQLTDEDRRLSEQVMALHYVDEVSVHGGMDKPVAPQLAALNRSEHAALVGYAEPHSISSDGDVHQVPQRDWPDGLAEHQRALNQTLAPVLDANGGQWTLAQTQQLQAYALRTAVHHYLGPEFKGAWLSQDGQRVGVLDSVGVLRDFAVTEAWKQSPQQSWSEAASGWEVWAHETAVSRARPGDHGTCPAPRFSETAEARHQTSDHLAHARAAS